MVPISRASKPRRVGVGWTDRPRSEPGDGERKERRSQNARDYAYDNGVDEYRDKPNCHAFVRRRGIRRTVAWIAGLWSVWGGVLSGAAEAVWLADLAHPRAQAERHNSRRTLPRVTQDSHTERTSLRPRVSPRVISTVANLPFILFLMRGVKLRSQHVYGRGVLSHPSDAGRRDNASAHKKPLCQQLGTGRGDPTRDDRRCGRGQSLSGRLGSDQTSCVSGVLVFTSPVASLCTWPI